MVNMHLTTVLSFLFVWAAAAAAWAHPSVSDPRRVLAMDEFDIEDVYKGFPKDQRPLHTTVLMAKRPRATASPRDGDL